MAVEWSKALRNGWDYGFEPRPLSKRNYFASSMFTVFFSGDECGSGQPILRQGEEALEADEVRRSSVQEGS